MGLEPMTSGATIRRSSQLSYDGIFGGTKVVFFQKKNKIKVTKRNFNLRFCRVIQEVS